MAEKAKRANGEGTYEKLKNGWRYRVVVEVNGVFERKSFSGKTKPAALQAYKNWMASDNKVAIEKVRTVGQWAEHWLEIYCKPKVSYPVHKDYKGMLDNHILPFQVGAKTFQSMKLGEVKPAHIAGIYAGMKTRKGDPVARSTLEKAKILLNGIFTTAIDNGLCGRNPVASVKLPEKVPRQIIVPDRTTVQAILEHTAKSENGPYIAFLLFSGVRVGELLALTWENLDQEKHLIHIRQHLARTANGEVPVPGTKTKRERVVPYDDALQAYIELIPHKGAYVVSREVNGLFTYHNHGTFAHVYYKFFKELGDSFPRLSPHKLRHTYATYLWENGVDLGYIQKLLGHASIQTTTVYAHARIEALRASVSKLDFGGQPVGNSADIEKATE